MNARREPQAALDPPAEWWGPEENKEVEEIGSSPESLLIEALAVKLKHLQLPASVIAINECFGTWTIHIDEDNFRKTYTEYQAKKFDQPPYKSEIFVDVCGIKVFSITRIEEVY